MALSDANPENTRRKDSGGERISGLALLVASAFFMEFLDGTVIATALPDMADSFHVSAIDLNIGISAYLLTLAMLVPASGWIAERFGARRTFTFALFIFTLASAFCGLAGTVGMFVSMRILQGVGGALMVPVGRLVVLRSVNKENLIKAIATLTWPALIAPIIGPPLGGFITTYFSWHWIFFLNIPLGLIAIAVSLKLMPVRIESKKQPFDVIGFVFMSLTMLCFVGGLEIFSQENARQNEGAVLIALGCLALFLGVRHLRNHAYPLIKLSSLTIPTFKVTMRGGFILRASISSTPFMLPLMFQLGFGLDAFQSGTLVLAVFCGLLAMKPATTPLIRYFGFKKLLFANGILCVVSLVLCAMIAPTTPHYIVLLVLFFSGLTRSMEFTGISSLAFADVPGPEMNSANTLFSTSLQLASGLGVTLGALSIRSGKWLTDLFGIQEIPAISYRLAFVVMAVITALALVDIATLAPGAGNNVARKRK